MAPQTLFDLLHPFVNTHNIRSQFLTGCFWIYKVLIVLAVVAARVYNRLQRTNKVIPKDLPLGITS